MEKSVSVPGYLKKVFLASDLNRLLWKFHLFLKPDYTQFHESRNQQNVRQHRDNQRHRQQCAENSNQ